ncbi:LysR family transcriptional regulator [Bradyrhizobium japonicum]|uniref:LysR family transcriptional regulator n=1 Tax=Bradyrhizobium japonicum TaxID=375 RepID=UPI001BA7D2F5|nr:LysR family transcriptional regulator [Bradyrhizobium japonicum]MBR0743198.1 LysR family transcriptional regulator [Bradyrhizobium japonicum]
MDFTALRYFSATAQSRSIRAASDRLHVSPSAISRQIAKLEHELRAPIFDRHAQGMKLTPAGEILLSKMDSVMREFSRVKSHIAALQDLQAGNVDIYCFQTAIESFVAPVLNRFHTQYPDVTFNVRMSSTDEAIEALITGTAEISLVINPPAHDNITRLEVFRDRMVAVFSPQNRLAGRKIVLLRELEDFPFALTEPSFGLRQQLDRVFARHGFEPNTFCVTNSLALVKEVASIGNNCTVLPRFAVERELAAGTIKSAAVRELGAEPLGFFICTLSDRSLSPAAKVFMDIVVDYCRRYRV